ncbi:MAG: PrgI family protein [Candidatus Levybacteria bacterium]|nr:PrgI family protein [Candidatus Levybacteria bacterium]
MENHPIPQDVTGFQFKLIGNMTIKQFAYLATGIVLAWVVYALPLSRLITFPLALILGFLGFALAFLPIDGRPMDAMVAYFIKALFTPNQYVFQKTALQSANTSAIRVLLSTPKPDQAPKENLPKEEKQLQTKTEQTAPPEPQTEESITRSQYESVMEALGLAKAEKERLEQQILVLKEALAKTQQQTTAAPPPTVKKIPVKTSPATRGLLVSDAPNVLSGIVKDPRGNVLSNILVEVKDKDGNPVRAFKTNAFGQFASATPLLNGVYTLEFDDSQGKQKFDAAELTITGEIINPIEVTSIDQREELRKTLFG